MMQNYQNFDLVSKFQKKIAHIWGVIVEKLKGGSEKVEILVACNLHYLQQKSPK